MPIPRLSLPCAAALGWTCLVAPTIAQSGTGTALRLNADMRYGLVATDIPNFNTPQRGESMVAMRGLMQFRSDLTFRHQGTEYRPEPSRQVTVTPIMNNGTYVVTSDARVVVDEDPANPGTELTELFVDPELSMFLGARRDTETLSWLLVGLRTSSGQTDAALNGAYYSVEHVLAYGSSGRLSRTSERIFVMDGAGNYTYSGIEEDVDWRGVVTMRPLTGSGAYTVSPDGHLVLGNATVTEGQIAPDGDVFFTVTAHPQFSAAAMAVAVRLGTSYDAAALVGDWGFSMHEIGQALMPGYPYGYTADGELQLMAQGSTSGSYASEFVEVESSSLGVGGQTSQVSGTFTLAGNGNATLRDTGSYTTRSLTFSRTGDVFVGTDMYGASNLTVGMRVCSGSGPFGTPSLGTGGIPPVVEMSRFPSLGSQNFAVDLLHGRGGATAIVPIAFGPGSGLPFAGGGTWVNFAMIIHAPVVRLSGPNGVAGVGEASLPLPLPTNPVLVGLGLYAQGYVLDPGTRWRLAMTGGLEIRPCR